MPNIKYCKNCSAGKDRMKRIYIRENKPIILEATEYPYINKTLGYKRKFNAIGWVCETCRGVAFDDLDNQEEYIPFNVFHKLEFDYKQLLSKMDFLELEQK